MSASLKAAMLSMDSSLTSLIQQAATKLEIQVLEMEDAARYLDLVSQEPFDVLLLDCEGLPAAKELVCNLRQNSANLEALFMIAGVPDESSNRIGFGEHVTLFKPLTSAHAEGYFRDAIKMMQERHRRYERHPVEMDVLVTCQTKNWQLSARSKALGEGGIGLQLPQKIVLEVEDIVSISFQLPETHDRFELAANLAWINNDAEAGFRFKPLTTSNAARLAAWLNQQTPPVPGASRKEIVESWLAKHGKESGTVVISAGLRKQLIDQEKPSAATIAEAPLLPIETPEAEAHRLSTRTLFLIVAGFLFGIAAGLVLARLYHLS